MKKLIINIFILFTTLSLYAQRDEITITFSAENNNSHIIMDSIIIENLNNNTDTSLYYPDTTLMLEYITGVQQNQGIKSQFKLTQNYPNPFAYKTSVDIFLPDEGRLIILIYNLIGREYINYSQTLNSGLHSFEFKPGNQSIYLLTAIFNSNVSTIKMINNSIFSKGECSFKHTAHSLHYTHKNKQKSHRKSYFDYQAGDKLRYLCYADSLVSGVVHKPLSSALIIFEFATNIPCPSQPTVYHFGKTYNTIQIYGQCWLKENLDVGIMINGQEDQTNNDILEKYCYNNDTNNCNEFGGMYQWGEMMDYIDIEGSQGICPEGWHVPTDEEWVILEGITDSLYTITDSIWYQEEYRGYDVGKRLKSTSGWEMNGNGTNLFGFEVFPAGTRSNFGDFILQGRNAPFWSSTSSSATQVWYRVLTTSNLSYRYSFDKDSGFAVRCLKNTD